MDSTRGHPNLHDLPILYLRSSCAFPSRAFRGTSPRRDRCSPRGGTLLAGIVAYELSNIAAVLLLLRATKLMPDGAGPFGQPQLVALLYIVYQLSAAVAATPAGALADRVGAGIVIANGAVLLLASYAGFAAAPRGNLPVLLACFVLAGTAAGAVDAAEYAGVGRLASPGARWTAFGVLAAIQSIGRMVATITAGALWTFVSPTVGLVACAPLLVAGTLILTVGIDTPTTLSGPAPRRQGRVQRRVCRAPAPELEDWTHRRQASA
jgi:MFS family permease